MGEWAETLGDIPFLANAIGIANECERGLIFQLGHVGQGTRPYHPHTASGPDAEGETKKGRVWVNR